MTWKLLFVGLCCVLLQGAQVWSKDPSSWTARDAEEILQHSPWALQAAARFPGSAEDTTPAPVPLPGAAQAGMAGPRGASDGHWDGGVGRMPRGGLPILSVTVRWDSALPVREAVKLTTPGDDRDAGVAVVSPEEAEKFYVLSVVGLIPAKAYKSEAPAQSQAQDEPEGRDPKAVLEGMRNLSRLIPSGEPAIAPQDVRLDAANGAIHIYFPRTPIELKSKEVTFITRFGSVNVRQQFRLKDMVYRKKLAL